MVSLTRLWMISMVSVQLFAWFTSAAPPLPSLPPPVYSCSSSEQSHDIDASVPGEIISPGFPGKYPDNQDCSWKLKAPLHSVIRIKITSFNLEQDDFVTISDGETAHGDNLIAKYSLCMEGPLSLFSTGMAMLIQFKSNRKEAGKGFKISYKTVRRDKIVKAGKVNNICSFKSISRDTSGYVASPWFPNSLQKPIACTWHVIGPTDDNAVYLSYKMMGLVPQSPFGGCKNDFVRHLQPPKMSDYICGCKLPSITKAPPKGKIAYIEMDSKTNYNQPGFLIYHKTMDPSSCADPSTCSAMKDDRDVGFDKHANIKYEKKDITTPPPTKRPPDDVVKDRVGPFRVQCYKDDMKVALNYTRFPLLEEESAALLDPKCKIYRRDSTHIYLKTPLDGCGTYHNYSSDGRYVIYHNQIVIKRSSVKPGDLITRDHDAVFEFECRYHRRMVMSVVHFTPARATVYTETENFGNFTFMMQMYKSKKYKEAFDKYPVYVMASHEIYVQTEVKAKDAELVLNIDKCVVTPSTDPNDKEFYDLIKRSCPVDETLEYDHKVSSVQRFNFKAFYFNVDKQATVHIHCTVRVCRKADKNSRCVKGCTSRHRRAVSEVNEDEITTSLSLGPVQLQQEGETGQTSDSSPKMFVEIVVGVLGFFVVVLLVAVMVVLLKKQKQQRKEALSLMVDDSEH